MNLTFANYFKVWFETYREPKVRDVTIQKYLIVLDLLENDELGQIQLKKIKRKDVQEFFNRYGQTRRRQTVLDTKTYINASLLDAQHDGFIKINPCARIEVVSVEDRWTVAQRKAVRDEKKWLEIDEYKNFKRYLIGTIHVALSQSPNATFTIKDKRQEVAHSFNNYGWLPQMILIAIYIALKTGARFSEIIGITEEDIDFKNAILNIDKTWDYKFGKKFIPTKNLSSIRQVLVDQEFLVIMQQYLEWMKKHEVQIDSGAILVAEKVKIYNSTINSVLKNLFLAIDIEPISIHKLRHTQASILIAQKISLQVIAKRLGHNDTTMIQQTYGHLLESIEEEENKKLLELI